MANSPLRKILPFQRDSLSVMVVGLQSEIPQFKAIQNEEGGEQYLSLSFCCNGKTKVAITPLTFISVPGMHTAPSEDLGSAVLRQLAESSSLRSCDRQRKHF